MFFGLRCFLLLTLFALADVCNTAVKNPVGKVNADSQKMLGGCAVVAHFSKCSTLITKSLVQAASGFSEG